MTFLASPDSNRRHVWRWLLIAAIAANIGVVIAIWLNAHIEFGYDFGSYWRAAERAAAGGSPYAAHMLSGSVDAIGIDHYRYPPPLAVALSALVPVGPQLALWLWTAVSAFVFFGAIEQVRRLLNNAHLRRWLWLGVVMFIPASMALLEGNVTAILTACYAAVLIGLKTNRPGLTGFGWGVGALLKLEPALLALWLLRRRSWAALGWGVAWIVGISAISALSPAGSAGWLDYPRALFGMLSGTTAYAQNASPASLLQLSLPALESVSFALVLLQAGFAIGLAWWAGGKSLSAGFMIASAASLLLGPPTWQHSVLVLLPAGIYLWNSDSGARKPLALAFVACSLGVFFAPLQLIGIGLAIYAAIRSQQYTTRPRSLERGLGLDASAV